MSHYDHTQIDEHTGLRRVCVCVRVQWDDSQTQWDWWHILLRENMNTASVPYWDKRPTSLIWAWRVFSTSLLSSIYQSLLLSLLYPNHPVLLNWREGSLLVALLFPLCSGSHGNLEFLIITPLLEETEDKKNNLCSPYYRSPFLSFFLSLSHCLFFFLFLSSLLAFFLFLSPCICLLLCFSIRYCMFKSALRKEPVSHEPTIMATHRWINTGSQMHVLCVDSSGSVYQKCVCVCVCMRVVYAHLLFDSRSFTALCLPQR